MKFDLLGPLPHRTTVLEASAGSGKTYAIVALATRYIAEGLVEPAELMLVTFSRTATQELRERTRERLTTAATALTDPIRARATGDPLVSYLARGSATDVAARLYRLRRALSDFDAATIATTHSFCQRMLDGLGIAGERDPDAILVESVDDLLTDVVDDLYLRRYAGDGSVAPELTPTEAREAATAAVQDRQATLAPADAGVDTRAGQRVALALAARDELERRKRSLGVRDFDDLLTLLRDTLADPEHGDAACRRIRDRYRVVLVDEFQDTDPVQWEILRRAFHGSTTLILVGDPKQAIYAFRGAEVLSYLQAVQLADNHLELTTNWRSDHGLVQALDHLYGGAALGHPKIVVHPIAAAHPGPRLAGQTPFRLRFLPRQGAGTLNRGGFPAVVPLRTRVALDLAADVVRLLDSGAELTLENTSRPIEPGDIAVLVRNRRHVPFVHSALVHAGVPAVLAGGTSVFATVGASEWLWMLQALEQPQRSDRVRLAALTSLLGHTALELDRDGEDIVTAVSGQARELAMVFAESGFAALFDRLATQTRLERRLLGVQGGERQVTDLRHIAQLLNRVAVDESFGLTALTSWLAARVNDLQAPTMKDQSRRLDSDSAAVQILTVHSSKGLEFPVVYLPYAWDGAKNPNFSTLLLHGPGGERILDVGGKGSPGYQERQKINDTEEAGEELRLLYVAATRAMCQVVAWWAPSAGTSGAPLQRMLMGRTAGVPEPAAHASVPQDETVAARMTAWAAQAPQVITVTAVGAAAIPPARWEQAEETPVPLAAARFDRNLDLLWRRASYSSLTASAHDATAVRSEAEQPEKTDEPAEEPPIVDVPGETAPSAEDIPSPMNGLPAGAAFGTLVHEVLEVVDTTAADLAAELLTRCQAAVAARLAPVDPAALATALLPVMRTPLGFGTLADIDPSDRLAELDFELPLAGGDNPTASAVTLNRVAALLREHLPADDPLARYADLLDTLDAPPLRGYLAGSIDAVLRIPGPRFVVIDYKTNRLAREDLSTLHFTREKMAAEMLRAHYPLQALLYSVAVHRYLRWRQPGYDPGRHLGGVQYLFVRGMVGARTPPGCGVFDWKPPSALVVTLSDLLAGT